MAIPTTTKIGLDVSDVVSSARAYAQSLGVQVESLDNLIVKNIEFNRQGKVVRAEIEAQIDAYRKLALEVGKASKAQVNAGTTIGGPNVKGNLGIVSGGVVNAPIKTPVIDPANVAAATAASEKIRQLFPVPPTASIAQLSRYENAIQRITTVLATGKVSGARFNELFNNLQAGKALGSLTGDESKLVSALGNISKGFATAKESSEKFHLGLRETFRIAEALLLKDAIGAIVQQFQQGVVSAAAFQVKISEIRTIAQDNQSSFGQWSKTIQSVSDKLGVPQIDVAEAAYNALSNQVTHSREETEKFILTAGDLGRVGVAKTSEAVELLSSSLNAFQIDIGRSEELSAKFFKAVDLGRFKIQDLAGNFGRIAAPAANLGVNLEDVLTSMAVLTNEGIKADDASTQLLNVFLKLTKPTKTMSDFLNSMGFETGQAAIQALGFQGVLTKIGEAAKGDAQLLAELGGELRSIRGLTGLTTRGQADKFSQFKSQIAGPNVQADFEKAKTIRAESPGDELIKEVNKIKNSFTDDFGQGFLAGLAKINKEFLSLSDSVKFVSTAVVSGIKAWALYKVSTLGAGIATTVLTTNYKALIANTLAATAATEKLTFAQRTQGFLGGIAKLATGIFIASEILDMAGAFKEAASKGEEFETVLEKIKNARKDLNAVGEKNSNVLFANQQNQLSAEFSSDVDKTFAPVLANLAKASQESRAHLADLRADGLAASQALSVSFQGATDKIKNTIKTYAENISKAKSSIERSTKDITGLADTADELIFKLRQKFASPDQQFFLRANEIANVRGRIRQLYEDGTDEAVAQAKALTAKLFQLTAEDVEARTEAEIAGDKALRQKQLTEGRITPDQANAPIFANPDIGRIRNVAGFAANLEKENIEKQKEKIRLNQIALDQEKERLRTLEKAQKEFVDFEPTTKTGEIKPEFKTPTGQFDPDKFDKEFKKKSNAVVELSDTMAEKLGTLNLLEAKRKVILDEQAALIKQQRINTQQQELGTQKDQLKKDFGKAGQDRVGARTDFDKIGNELSATTDILNLFADRAKGESSIKTIGQDADPIRKFGLQIANLVTQGINAIPGGNKVSVTERDRIAQENQPLFAEIVNLNKKIIEDRDKIVARDQQGNLLGKPADLVTLQQDTAAALNKVSELVGKFAPDLSLADRENLAPPGGASVGELRKTFGDEIKGFGEAFEKEKRAQAQQEALRTTLQGFADKNAAAIGNNINAINPNTEAIKNNTISLQDFMKQLQAKNPIAADNIPVDVPTFHTGGLIKGPRGFDNLHIRAEAGEFIMNQNATAKWLPQLIQMNRGGAPRVPGHYHEGGFVQTNVGDVNVTISGSVSPQKNIRQIGQALRREIKRGNLNLNTKD